MKLSMFHDRVRILVAPALFVVLVLICSSLVWGSRWGSRVASADAISSAAEQSQPYAIAVTGADQNHLPSDGSRPPADSKWILVRASLQNLSGQPAVVQQCSLVLVDVSGRRYSPEAPGPHAQPSLVGARLAMGQWILGQVLFEVPRTVTGTALEWWPDGGACEEPLHSRIPGAPVATPSPTAVSATTTSTPTVTASATPTSTPSDESATILINTGGSSFTGSDGRLWSSDNGYVGGHTYKVDNVAIVGTSDPYLYQTERWGADGFSYHFAVPNGTYTVNLRFAEIFWTLPGQRVFNVSINGQTALRDFDIIAATGAPNTATDRSFKVNVAGGSLDIVLSTVIDAAKLSGLEFVLERAPTATPTATPRWTATMTATSSPTPAATSTFTASATPTTTSTATATATIVVAAGPSPTATPAPEGIVAQG